MKTLIALTAFVLAAPASAATTISVTGYFTGTVDGQSFNTDIAFVGVSEAGPENIPDGQLYRLDSFSAELLNFSRTVTFLEDDVFFASFPGFDQPLFGRLSTDVFFRFSEADGELLPPFPNTTFVAFQTDLGPLRVETGTGLSLRIETSSTPAVPEPATWALMISGFGLVGSAMRRGKAGVSFA